MKIRKYLVLTLLLLLVFALAGCRCDPATENWYIQNFPGEEVFVNGVSHLLTYTGVPSARDPFAGMPEHFISISFGKDGTVTFCPGTGETLIGTYTIRHSGLSSTDFTVTLSNGESFTGNSQEFYYGSSMSFVFRDRGYVFKNNGGDAKQYYDTCLQDLCKSIRVWSETDFGDVPVRPCNIFSREDKLILQPADDQQPFFLDHTVAVRCFRLDGENQLHKLDAIGEGDCFYTKEVQGNVTDVTLYYVDPVAEN